MYDLLRRTGNIGVVFLKPKELPKFSKNPTPWSTVETETNTPDHQKIIIGPFQGHKYRF